AKPNILIVDEDADLLGTFAPIVRSWGIAEVVTAADGEQATKALESGSFSLILCDYMMPNMDGMTLKEHLNKEKLTRDIPFVMISGYGTPALLDMAVSRGIAEWLDKPVESKVLRSCISKFLPHTTSP